MNNWKHPNDMTRDELRDLVGDTAWMGLDLAQHLSLTERGLEPEDQPPARQQAIDMAYNLAWYPYDGPSDRAPGGAGQVDVAMFGATGLERRPLGYDDSAGASDRRLVGEVCDTCHGDETVWGPIWGEWENRCYAAQQAWLREHSDEDWYASQERRALLDEQPARDERYLTGDAGCAGTGIRGPDATATERAPATVDHDERVRMLRDGLAVMDWAVELEFEAARDDDAWTETATEKVAGDGFLWSAVDKRRRRETQAAEAQLGELLANPDRWWDRATTAQIADAYRAAKLTQTTDTGGRAIAALEDGLRERYGVDVDDLDSSRPAPVDRARVDTAWHARDDASTAVTGQQHRRREIDHLLAARQDATCRLSETIRAALEGDKATAARHFDCAMAEYEASEAFDSSAAFAELREDIHALLDSPPRDDITPPDVVEARPAADIAKPSRYVFASGAPAEDCRACGGDTVIGSPARHAWNDRVQAALGTWRADHDGDEESWWATDEAAALIGQAPVDEETKCPDCHGSGLVGVQCVEDGSLVDTDGEPVYAVVRYQGFAELDAADTGAGPAPDNDADTDTTDTPPPKAVDAEQSSTSGANQAPNERAMPGAELGRDADAESGIGDGAYWLHDSPSPVDRAQQAVLELKGRRVQEERDAQTRIGEGADLDRTFYHAAAEVDARGSTRHGEDGPTLSAFDD